jgi:hypothetical protein
VTLQRTLGGQPLARALAADLDSSSTQCATEMEGGEQGDYRKMSVSTRSISPEPGIPEIGRVRIEPLQCTEMK